MTQKHTPGPWEVISKRDNTNMFSSIYGEGYKGLLVARCNQNGAHEADAHLIAAAPDLLAALQWMVANDETNEGDEPIERLGGMTWNEYNAYYIDGLNRARAAIAKAEGRS